MQIYGLMYMGGKSQIAGDILELIPPAPAFIDLFGGGGAMSHAAYLSGKFGAVHYNELLPKTYGAFSRAVAGTLIPSALRFVGRDDYDPDDPYCALMWSISLDNQYETYAYPRVSEPLWRALWGLRVDGDASALESVGVFSDVSSNAALKRNRAEIIAQYRKYYITEVLGLPTDVDAGDLAQAYDRAIKERGETIRLFLRDCLAKAGKTQADVDRHLGTNGMAGHYFGASEWELPHAEAYGRMREIIPDLPPYNELLRQLCADLRGWPIETVRALLDLHRYTEKLAPERSTIPPRIQRAQALKGLNITCTNGDYRDVPIPAGAVVYADPPYYGTTQYDDKAPPFDTAGLLDYLARLPNAVYLSETSRIQDMASAHGFTMIWTKDRHRNMCAKAGNRVTECVYYKETRDG